MTTKNMSQYGKEQVPEDNDDNNIIQNINDPEDEPEDDPEDDREDDIDIENEDNESDDDHHEQQDDEHQSLDDIVQDDQIIQPNVSQQSYNEESLNQNCHSTSMSFSSSTTKKLTYNQIVANFQQVASTIQHNQEELCRLNNAMDDLLHRYHQKDSVEIFIRTIAKLHDSNIVGTTHMNINATRGCRKMSFRESQQKRGRGKKCSLGNGTGIVASVVGQHNDNQSQDIVGTQDVPRGELCQKLGKDNGFVSSYLDVNDVHATKDEIIDSSQTIDP
eukprot:scaffold138900_cov52-Attheya_sp.AAC.2